MFWESTSPTLYWVLILFSSHLFLSYIPLFILSPLTLSFLSLPAFLIHWLVFLISDTVSYCIVTFCIPPHSYKHISLFFLPPSLLSMNHKTIAICLGPLWEYPAANWTKTILNVWGFLFFISFTAPRKSFLMAIEELIYPPHQGTGEHHTECHWHTSNGGSPVH